MQQITSAQVTPAFKLLFRSSEPQGRRAFAVLEGKDAGRIFTDDPARATWGIVWEMYDGCLYFGGAVDAAIVAQVFAAVRRTSPVLVGLWPGDPRWELLPPAPDYDGFALEFYDRPVGRGLERFLNAVPAGCVVRRMDAELIMRSEWGAGDVAKVGGVEAWLATCFGYCLLQGDDLLCEATVGVAAQGLREPGVFTHNDHRGKGYATITSAYLIQEIEALGDQTYWNCAKQNPASAAVARKLGYRVEQEYRVVAWGA